MASSFRNMESNRKCASSAILDISLGFQIQLRCFTVYTSNPSFQFLDLKHFGHLRLKILHPKHDLRPRWSPRIVKMAPGIERPLRVPMGSTDFRGCRLVFHRMGFQKTWQLRSRNRGSELMVPPKFAMKKGHLFETLLPEPLNSRSQRLVRTNPTISAAKTQWYMIQVLVETVGGLEASPIEVKI